MANAYDYLAWRGDISLQASPLCEVDLFLFSQLSTPDFTNIVPSGNESISLEDAVKQYFSLHDESVDNLGILQSETVLPTVHQMPQCERYKKIRLSAFQNHVIAERDEQFCAMTILLPDGGICVSFRGTDDTIIGWKENFNMAVMDTIPAQQDAQAYLANVAAYYEGPIWVCGHSKGGNLAVYSAATVSSSVQARIAGVYSIDGPGFQAGFLASEGYNAINNRVYTLLSQHSMVGVLLLPAGKQIVVRSTTKGPYAHDSFTWEVVGRCFVRCEERSELSYFFENTVNQTLAELEQEEKSAFIEELFQSLLSTGAQTISDLTELKFKDTVELTIAVTKDARIQKFVRTILEAIRKNVWNER